MPKYIKSHSNYVLKNKHQLVNDGTIYERDITTIGAVNQFAPGQKPIYRSGNFIVTVRDDRKSTNQYNQQNWEKGTDGETWTLSTVSSMTSSDKTQDDTKIFLKNDYYDFREFAYYGSLTEMFRASMTDILARFPGELYCVPDTPAYYTSGYTIDFSRMEESVRIGEEDEFYVSNPYEINIHTKQIPAGEALDNKLKYFASNGYKNYTIYNENDEFVDNVNSWVVTSNVDACNPGDLIATILINGTYTFKAYVGDGHRVVYVHKNNGIHIRPNDTFKVGFYNECSDFERLVLNENTTPKYKAVFSVIKDNEYGYYRELEEFIFPTSEGGYNPSVNTAYVNRLIEIGEYYDEQFTDNLYRSMTHEAIKNFDWSYTREYTNGDEETYQEGGQKIQKALRVFAREFDDIKLYIDNIKNCNRITYDERSNLPDYFLTDSCTCDGWNIKSIIPYNLSGISFSGDESADTAALLANTAGVHNYSQTSKNKVNPYASSAITDGTAGGYFVTCEGGGSGISCYLYDWYGDTIAPSGGKTYTFGFPSNRLVVRVKPYSDDANTYTYMDVNNEFLKRLKLNSRYIWRHKGTIEGIEMILGMFGLKSKRWLERSGKVKYSGTTSDNCQPETCGNVFPDYEIIEYTQYTNRIIDKWDDTHQMYWIDWINSTKLIVYNYNLAPSDNTKNRYVSYQGLPVSYRAAYLGEATEDTIINNVAPRYLYPNFNKDEQLDGNPYFQMNGGWLAKTLNGIQNFQFDIDDNIVHTPVVVGREENGFVIDNHKLYKETIRTIKRVKDINALLSLPQYDLYDGIICYVGKVKGKTAIIDGDAFEIEYDSNGDMFVRFVRKDGYIKVGGLYYDNSISVLSVYYTDGNKEYVPVTYTIYDKLDGYEVKAYIKFEDGEYTFVCKSPVADNYSYIDFNVIDADDEDSNRYSNYFKLNNIAFFNEITTNINGDGWRRLAYTDSDYLKVNTIYNYYEGNNGHNGNMSYDSGHEYFTYFQRLFKHAEDNDMFNDECYVDKDLYDVLRPDNIPIGFSGLINSNESVTDYDGYINSDSKVHYFGNYKETNGTIHIYGDRRKYKDNVWKQFYGSDKTIQFHTIGDAPYLDMYEKTDDDVTNQIVNNKRIKIKFNMRNQFGTSKGQCELKYLDDIVMNYLTQLIPSTCITEIEYQFCGFNNKDC